MDSRGSPAGESGGNVARPEPGWHSAPSPIDAYSSCRTIPTRSPQPAQICSWIARPSCSTYEFVNAGFSSLWIFLTVFVLTGPFARRVIVRRLLAAARRSAGDAIVFGGKPASE